MAGNSTEERRVSSFYFTKKKRGKFIPREKVIGYSCEHVEKKELGAGEARTHEHDSAERMSALVSSGRGKGVGGGIHWAGTGRGHSLVG